MDFSRAQGVGRRQRGRHLVVVIAPGGAARSRVGFAVSRKVGGAVVRNRVKRWLREAVRVIASSVPPNVDAVIIAQPAAAEAGLDVIRAELGTLLSRFSR